MCVRKNLNQRVRRIGKKNGKSFKVVSKTKKGEKHLKGLIITQFKIEFLLPFTGCRKVLEKMPVIQIREVNCGSCSYQVIKLYSNTPSS